MTLTANRIPLPLTNRLDQYVKELLDTATQSVARETGQWLLLAFSRTNGLPTLRFFVDPQGRAHATLSRRRDGTLSYRLRDGAHHDSLLDDHQELYQDLKDHLASRIAQRALEQSPRSRTTVLQALHRKQSRESIARFLDDKADRLAQNHCSTVIMPSGPRNAHIADFPSLPRRLVRTHFINQEIHDLSKHLRRESVRAYNFVARNFQLLVDLQRQEPQTMTYLLRHLPPEIYQPRPRTLTPQQVEQVIQDQLQLTPDERPLLNSAARVHDQGYRPGTDTRNRIRNFCTHLARAGIDRQTAETTASYAGSAHRKLSDDGVPQPRWLHVLTLFHQHRDQPDAPSTLQGVTDKMEYPRRNQSTCTPRTWDECRREAQLAREAR